VARVRELAAPAGVVTGLDRPRRRVLRFSARGRPTLPRGAPPETPEEMGLGKFLRRMIVVAAPVVWSRYRRRRQKQRAARATAAPTTRR